MADQHLKGVLLVECSEAGTLSFLKLQPCRHWEKETSPRLNNSVGANASAALFLSGYEFKGWTCRRSGR